MDGDRYASSDPSASSASAPEAGELEDFRDKLRIFAARRLGDWTAAEDVAQEALRLSLEAMRAGRIESSAALPGFLYRTALNICMHRGRSAAREMKALKRFGAGDEGEGGEGVLDALISAEQQASVREAMGRLEPDERLLLELTYRDELSSEDIGQRLGLTAGAVRVRRHRVIRRLAEWIGVTRTSDREF